MCLMQMLIKCADIGHLAAAPRTHKRWATQLEEEFFKQVLCCAVLRCAVLRCAALCCAVLCCACADNSLFDCIDCPYYIALTMAM